MTRAARGSRAKALANSYAKDPVDVVVQILRRVAAPMTATAIKKELIAGGVAATAMDESHWRPVREGLALHLNVVVDGLRYAWTADRRTPSPAEALDLIARKRTRLAELVEIVRAGLGPSTPSTGAPVDLEEAARRRQADIDARRSLAELAAEVEELAVNEARAPAMIHRVRARVKRSDLEPIDRAGDETTFDRKRHKPISGSIPDGAPVVVVRPGYVWKAPTEDVLVAKAIVEE